MLEIGIKVANYEGPILDLISKYSKEFVPLQFGREDVKKYFMFQDKNNERVLIMISQSEWDTKKDYNIIISVFGPTQSLVKETLDEIVNAMNVEVKEAPPWLKQKVGTFLSIFSKGF